MNTEQGTPKLPAARDRQARAARIAMHMAKAALGLSIIGILLWKYDFNAVWRSIRDADFTLWLAAWLSMACGVWFHSLALERSLRPYRMDFTAQAIFKLHWELKFYALFLPGATNVIVKWYKLGKNGRGGEALAAIVFTRVLHTFSVVLLTVVGITLDPGFPWSFVKWAAIGVLFAVTLAMLLFVLKSTAPFLDSLSEQLWGLLPGHSRVRKNIEKLWLFITYLRTITMAQLATLALLTILGQAALTLSHVLIAHSVGIDVTVYTLLWLRSVVLVCTIIPVSISGMGLREVSLVGLLQYYQVPEHQALAYSLLHLGVTLSAGLIGGIVEFTNFVGRQGPLANSKRKGD